MCAESRLATGLSCSSFVKEMVSLFWYSSFPVVLFCMKCLTDSATQHVGRDGRRRLTQPLKLTTLRKSLCRFESMCTIFSRFKVYNSLLTIIITFYNSIQYLTKRTILPSSNFIATAAIATKLAANEHQTKKKQVDFNVQIFNSLQIYSTSVNGNVSFMYD